MSATLTSRRRLATLGVVWFAFAFAPELALSSSPKPLGHGAVGALVYALTAVASLLTWWLLVAGIAALRARSRALGWVAVGIVGPVGTFLTVASVHYRWFFGTDVRPIAIAYLIEYPEYALTLVSHSLTWGARAALFGGAAFGIVVLGALTTKPLVGRARPPRWALALALAPIALVSVPRAGCSKLPCIAEVRGVRALVQGVAARGFSEPVHALPVPRRVAPQAGPTPRSFDVVVVVNESLSADDLAPWSGAEPAPNGAMAKLAAHGDHAVWFPDAVAVAPLTAVSVPSTLSGLAPDAPADDYARAPLVWHEAKARGYRTAFFSAQDFQIDFFEGFYLADGGPDEVKSAPDHPGERRVNDRGIDDARAIDDAIAFLERAPRDRPVLMVVQMNATHWPCWTPAVDGDAKLTIPERCARAVRYVDEEVGRLTDALDRTRGLENTLLVGTSDHGQSLDPSKPARPVSYHRDVLRVPLFVHVPASWCGASSGGCAALRDNRRQRASNLDVLPTVLDAWSGWPLRGSEERPALAGASLLRPLPRGRVMIALSDSAVSNALADGFAVFDGKWKWLIDEFHGVRLFDLEADPEERVNVAASAPPEAVEGLRGALRTHPRALAVCKRVAPSVVEGPYRHVSW